MELYNNGERVIDSRKANTWEYGIVAKWNGKWRSKIMHIMVNMAFIVKQYMHIVIELFNAEDICY